MDHVIAIDVGATNTRVALVTGEGTLSASVSSSTPVHGNSADIIAADLIRKINGLLVNAGDITISGIGISAAGPVDIHAGAIINPPNIPFPVVPLVHPLQDTFGVPVHMVNDCHAGVLGEYTYGCGSDTDNLLYITISTGIGAGAILNGRLVLGRDGNACEIGHFIVDDRYNHRCGCGHYGHWEGFSSGRHIPRFFRAYCGYNSLSPAGCACDTAQEIFSAAGNGNPVALSFIEELGMINARGFSDVIVAYDPEVIILDGSVVLQNRDLILGPMQRHLDHYLKTPEFRFSALDGRAPLLGASVIALGYETGIGSFRP
jgi:Transcriptional regulator/sugar kinase